MTGDPWMGRSLEWSTSSPPPAFNFAILPHVQSLDDYWRKEHAAGRPAEPAAEPQYAPIHMPRNSATVGFVCAFFASFGGFGMIWQIWWLVIVAMIGAFATFVVFAWRDRTEYEIPAEEVAGIDRADPSRAEPGARGAAGRGMTAFEAGAGYGGQHRGGGPATILGGGSEPLVSHADGSPASRRIIVGYGFWIFLLSDIVMFSAFFATYAVLSGETASGPSGKDLFNLTNVAIETAFLLISSFTCGIATIGARARRPLMYYGGMALTFVFGAGFLFIETREGVRRHDRARRRAEPQRLPVGVFHPRRLPRRPRHARPPVAAHRGRPGARQGLPGRHPPARPLLRPILAHAPTLSGWRYSPWSIRWE